MVKVHWNWAPQLLWNMITVVHLCTYQNLIFLTFFSLVEKFVFFFFQLLATVVHVWNNMGEHLLIILCVNLFIMFGTDRIGGRVATYRQKFKIRFPWNSDSDFCGELWVNETFPNIPQIFVVRLTCTLWFPWVIF